MSEAAKAVPLGLILPLRPNGDLLDEQRLHRLVRAWQGQSHDCLATPSSSRLFAFHSFGRFSPRSASGGVTLPTTRADHPFFTDRRHAVRLQLFLSALHFVRYRLEVEIDAPRFREHFVF